MKLVQMIPHLAIAALCVGGAACDDHEHSHDEHHGADLEPGHAEGDGHGHGQDEHAQGAGEPELPGLSVTRYENGLELFMEHDALIVGRDTPLIAHFTDTRDPEGFVWITKGQVTATLTYDDGAKEEFVANKLLRNGIFKPIVKATRPGKATLSLRLAGEQMQGVISAGPVVVYADTAAATSAAPDEDHGGEAVVGYLKETQWKTQYATELAANKVLQGGIQANGELKTVAGQAAELAAPVAGRLVVGSEIPYVGQQVTRGARLLSVVPTSVVSGKDPAELRLEQSRADSELSLANAELKRAEDLVAAKAIPERRLAEAKAAVDVATARVTAAGEQLRLYQGALAGGANAQSGSFALRSPIDGVVAFANVTPGAVVDAGTRLVYIVNTEKVWLEARIYEADVGQAEASLGAVFTVAGFDREFSVDSSNGRRIAVGAVVDPATRTVPIVFELDNKDHALKPGMYAKVTLLTGKTVQGVAIPDKAIVDDGGRPTVFVMEGGETFFKRRVELGVRSGGFAQVLSGVAEGERVVSRGAYEVKLGTAAGGIPEHGHQH